MATVKKDNSLKGQLKELEKNTKYTKDLDTAIRMRISQIQLKEFKLVAKENGVTMSGMFRMLLSDAVAKLKK